MKINETLEKEIKDYCLLNKIENLDSFKENILRQGFNIQKFGSTPFTKIVEKEIEKIVEIPVIVTDANSNEKINELTKLYEETKLKLVEMTNLYNKTKEQLNKEIIKNKKDIYGE